MRIRSARLAPGLFAALFVFVIGGCAPDDPSSPTIARNQVPAERVVALGNSLSAGFTNDALFLEGQLSGYANLVARSVSGEDMTLPLIASPGISGTLNTSGPVPFPQGQRYVTAEGAVEFRQLQDPSDPTSLLLASALPQPYDNLGVPGAFLFDVANTTSSLESIRPSNLFFDLILRNSALPPGNTTQLDQLVALVENGLPQTKVLIVWVGNNDVLIGTGTGDPVVRSVGGTDGNVTPAAEFQANFDALLTAIDALDVPQVALVNIPSVTSIPLATTINGLLAANGLAPSDVTTDEDDVAAILLSAQSVLFPGGSIDQDYLTGAKSLPSTFTLTNAEIAAVEAERVGYNNYLSSAAAARTWAFVDAASLLASLPLDPSADLNAVYPLVTVPGVGLVQNEGSGFSLDGVHPSEKGYARIANEVLDALNATYDEAYSTYDVGAVQNTLGFEDFEGPVAGSGLRVAPAPDAFRDPYTGTGAR